MKMASGYISFEAMYDYTPQGDGEIELKTGDQCLVTKPLPQTGEHGWLDGVNLRTRCSGQFPGTYCKVLSYDAMPPVPNKPKPKPSKMEHSQISYHKSYHCRSEEAFLYNYKYKYNSSGRKCVRRAVFEVRPTYKIKYVYVQNQVRLRTDLKVYLLRPGIKPKKVVFNDHHLDPIRIVKPVWCSLCLDYIWGGDRVSIVCSVCLLCAHSGCHQVYLQKCGDEKTIGIKPREEILKPVNKWSCDDVLEWMIAARLHSYVNIIKENNICGKDLPNITENDLKNMGIEFSLHAMIFKLCIDELLKVPTSELLKPLTFPFKENKSIETHNMFEHTFTTFQSCDICKKVMFGIFSQGFMCAVCGMQSHRPCAFSSMQPCQGRYQRGRRPSDSEEPSFCCVYKTISIPIVMRRCIETIEHHGIHTPSVYTSSSTYEPCQALRCALNQNPNTVNMNDEYWQDPRCAAYVLKTFLLELPESLIEPKCYEALLQLHDSPGSSEMSQVLALLRESSYAHLDYLLQHLARICKNSEENEMNVEMLSKVFSILLIRPNEWEARTLVSNLHLHEKVVSTLLQDYLINKGSVEEDHINNEIWFWPSATRRDVTQRLHGTPDGSFIVRPSEGRRGEWTLTVRKDRKDRLIKIIQRDGRYGFREDLLNFQSLPNLIKHFTAHTLTAYNTELNIKLQFPCGPLAPDITDGPDADLERLYIEIDEELKQIKMLEFQAEDVQKLLDECKVMSESQTDLINFLQEQIDLAEDQYREAPNADKQDIQQSLTNLHDMLHEERETWTELDANLVALKHECDLVNAQLTEKSTELPNLQKEHNRLYTIMRNEKPTELKVREDEDLQAIYDDLPLRIPTTSQMEDDLDVLDETYWLFPYTLHKADITAMLENKPDGTFLVRQSENYPYAISLVHDNSIKHVPILQGPDGYGFAEPHNTYRTLSELVNHYHHQSLRMHNKSLDTTLQTPYRFLEHTNDGPVYN